MDDLLPWAEPEPEPEPQARLPLLRRRIDSNPTEMQALQDRYGWVPGASSIRPRPDVLDAKTEYQANTEQFYKSDVDCVLDLVFDFPTKSVTPPSPPPRPPSHCSASL